jgi:hypothetical protein
MVVFEAYAIVRASARRSPGFSEQSLRAPAACRQGQSAPVFPSEYPEVQPYPSLRRLLKTQVDMQVADLQTLLCLPREEDGLGAGCNLTAAVLAVNIAAGASVLFWKASIEALKRRGDRGRRFTELMVAKYPWSRQDAVDAGLGTRLLWDYARNPLSHTLGIGKTHRLFPGIDADEREVWLSKPRRGLNADAVRRVMSSYERPDALEPTIESGPDGYTVHVVTLAWGVARMLRDLFADEEQAANAEATARALFGE